MWNRWRTRTWLKFAMVSGAAIAGIQLFAVAPALANAPNPNADIMGTGMVNANGTVTVDLSGTWAWPGQNCAGRYGEGWAVDWWGISGSKTPANSFTLTNASVVTAPGVTTTGSVSPAGAWQIKGTSNFFHVGQLYNGETVNSGSTCTDVGNGSQGSWSAAATYPNKSDLPPQLCVNMYDEHGSEGKPSGSATDFDPVTNGDNSIQTNSFNPQSGSGFCTTIKLAKPPGITLVKQVCKVAASKCSKSVNADWTSSHEIPSGSTAVWRITVTNSGGATLTDVTVSDPKASGCAGQIAASLAPGASVVTTCDSTNVTKGFRNVATVTGAPPSGANVTATGSATVTVIAPPPGITTSQSLTPNDEGFVNNGQEATGTMTFSLFPPNDPTCTGKPALTETVPVTNGVANTDNTTFVATAPGTWRWLVTYSGDATHKPATSPCGTEFFTLEN